MKYRFFKDDFNGRFSWAWPDEGYVTEDSAEIENYKALGIRHEEVKPVVKVVKETVHQDMPSNKVDYDTAKEIKKTRKKRQTKKAD